MLGESRLTTLVGLVSLGVTAAAVAFLLHTPPSPPVSTPATAASSVTSSSAPAHRAFEDVLPGNPYYAAIMQLVSLGVVSGYGGSPPLFGPEKPVSREQLQKMMVRATGQSTRHRDFALARAGSSLSPAALSPVWGFPRGSDVPVPSNALVTDHPRAAAFCSWLGASRAQAVAMIVTFVRSAQPGRLAATPPGYQLSLFTRTTPSAAAMAAAEYNRLLEGLPEPGPDWDPSVPATRGEVAQILWNLIRFPYNGG